MTLERSLVEQLLPAYEIEGELGRGAWGIVYAARHRHLGRQVAVKQLPRAFGADPDAKRRFVTEARLLASLDHPHIVPVYDYAEDGGLCLIVMERLSGGTLWARWSAQGLEPPAAVATTLAVCSGLQHAHDAGVLHRDIKPENILYAASGRPKLADFGIAKVLTVDTTHATRAGDVLGTPAYIAPEQAQGSTLGPATDLYSTAVVLYELLAGCLPFSEEGDAMALLWRHVYEAPRHLTLVADGLPGAISDVVMTALAKDPRDRPASAERFAIELARAATGAWGEGWDERAGVPLDLNTRVSEALIGRSAAPAPGVTSAPPSFAPPRPPRSTPTLVVGHAERNSGLTSPEATTTMPTTRFDRLAAKAAETFGELGCLQLATLLGRVAARTSPPRVTVLLGGSPRSGKSTLISGLTLVANGSSATELVEIDARATGPTIHHALLRGMGTAVDGVVLTLPAGRAVTADERETLATLTRARVPVLLCVTKSDLYPSDVTQQLILHTLRELPGVRFQIVAAALAAGDADDELRVESGLVQLATVFGRTFARPRIVRARGEAAGWVATAAQLLLADRDTPGSGGPPPSTVLADHVRAAAPSTLGSVMDSVISLALRDVASGLAALERAREETEWRLAADALVASLSSTAGTAAVQIASAIDELGAAALRLVWEAVADSDRVATLTRWDAGAATAFVDPARFVTAGLAGISQSLVRVGDLTRAPWELPGVGLTHAAAAHDAQLLAGRRRSAAALEPIRTASEAFVIELGAALRAIGATAVDELARDLVDLSSSGRYAQTRSEDTVVSALIELRDHALDERGG